MPGQVRRLQLIALRWGHDHVDLCKQLLHRCNCQRSCSHRLDIINRRIEPRNAELIWPIEGQLSCQQFVAPAPGEIVKCRRAFSFQHWNDGAKWKVWNLEG